MNPTKALALITTLLLGTSLFAAPANTHSTTATTKDTSMNTNQETDHYTFELSAKVTRQKVTFANRYGIRLTGDLYLPKNREGKTLPPSRSAGRSAP
ncbi:MAG TPA: hypothetical protein PLV33_07605 [Opitutaceae bacterium]|mgnify:CR=1 FL=1|nr:hypothetical protein [Opitutaceae bacterium]HOR24472.1 hypothetical protein [Opitutaceae bacterium]HPK48741.1 hypothetical protein [Opitutaceae bacterium]